MKLDELEQGIKNLRKRFASCDDNTEVVVKSYNYDYDYDYNTIELITTLNSDGVSYDTRGGLLCLYGESDEV